MLFLGDAEALLAKGAHTEVYATKGEMRRSGKADFFRQGCAEAGKRATRNRMAKAAKFGRQFGSIRSPIRPVRPLKHCLILLGDGGFGGTSCGDHLDDFFGESWGSEVAACGNDLVTAEQHAGARVLHGDGKSVRPQRPVDLEVQVGEFGVSYDGKPPIVKVPLLHQLFFEGRGGKPNGARVDKNGAGLAERVCRVFPREAGARRRPLGLQGLKRSEERRVGKECW